MSDSAILVEGLGKLYKLGPGARLRSASQTGDLLWALKDVCFEVKTGAVVGVIGRNGAGKSTLLKILSRITAPTTGRAAIRGRVASLLEVGTGFHPELTGRENVYMNGSILGMPRAEIARNFDEIVAFAGVERFLDTPLKRYSSGMQVRLGFSVAAHLESEILIVDEVLAVGDAQFRRRCIDRMRSASAEGRTVLLVSHDMQIVSTLASRCLLLESGQITCDAAPRDAIAAYLDTGSQQGRAYVGTPSSTEPRVTRVELETSEPNGVQRNAEPLTVKIEVSTPWPLEGVGLAFQFRDELARPVAHFWSYGGGSWRLAAGTSQAVCTIPKLRLYMGRYHLVVYFGAAFGDKIFQALEGLCPFEVVMHGQTRDRPFYPGQCVYLEDSAWSCRTDRDPGGREP